MSKGARTVVRSRQLSFKEKKQGEGRQGRLHLPKEKGYLKKRKERDLQKVSPGVIMDSASWGWWKREKNSLSKKEEKKRGASQKFLPRTKISSLTFRHRKLPMKNNLSILLKF